MSMYTFRREDILEQIYAVLTTLAREAEPEECYLQDILRVLREARAHEEPRTSFTLLPVLSCLAGGGVMEHAVPVAAAWRALHIAAHLLDSVQDEDISPAANTARTRALTINVATGILALAGLALTQVPQSVEEQTRRALHRDFQRAIVRAAGGQHPEFTRSPRPDLETYFHIAALKSGEPFALATQSWGVVAGASH